VEHKEETKLPILEDLGRRVAKRRETLGLGIRAAAKEIGVSHGDLSPETPVIAEVHFRKRATVSPKTAQALAQMILAAQEFLASGK
jgi:hypothetical protein